MIIHDLNEKDAEKCGLPMDGIRVISNSSPIHNCVGCFGCWIKTPGKCVIQDDYMNTGEVLGKGNELIIISECFYGGYSPFVKNVLDRSISYSLPYFTKRGGEVHHKTRYNNKINFSVYFYGDDITEIEKNTAIKVAQANARNFNISLRDVVFIPKKEMMEGKFNEYWSH